MCLEPELCNKRSHRNEKPVHRSEEWPPLTATRETPRAATKTQRSQKKEWLERHQLEAIVVIQEKDDYGLWPKDMEL